MNQNYLVFFFFLKNYLIFLKKSFSYLKFVLGRRRLLLKRLGPYHFNVQNLTLRFCYQPNNNNLQQGQTLFRSAGQFINVTNYKKKIRGYFLPPRAKRYPKGQIKFDIKNNMERNLPLHDTWIVHATTKWYHPLFTSYSFPLLFLKWYHKQFSTWPLCPNAKKISQYFINRHTFLFNLSLYGQHLLFCCSFSENLNLPLYNFKKI